MYHYIIEAKSLCTYCCNIYTVKTDVKTKAKVHFVMDIAILAKRLKRNLMPKLFSSLLHGLINTKLIFHHIRTVFKKQRWLNLEKYFQYCPILKKKCKITIRQLFNTKLKNMGQEFHIFFEGGTKLKLP